MPEEKLDEYVKDIEQRIKLVNKKDPGTIKRTMSQRWLELWEPGIVQKLWPDDEKTVKDHMKQKFAMAESANNTYWERQERERQERSGGGGKANRYVPYNKPKGTKASFGAVICTEHVF